MTDPVIQAYMDYGIQHDQEYPVKDAYESFSKAQDYLDAIDDPDATYDVLSHWWHKDTLKAVTNLDYVSWDKEDFVERLQDLNPKMFFEVAYELWNHGYISKADAVEQAEQVYDDLSQDEILELVKHNKFGWLR